MSSLEIAVLIAALAAAGAVAFFIVWWWLWPVRNTRLMRCPETGAIACVRVQEVWLPGRTSEELRVRWCDLWPRGKPCARGCLQRYNETAPGYRIRVEALRPFDQSRQDAPPP